MDVPVTKAHADVCILLDATRAGAFELFQFRAISHALREVATVFLVLNAEEDRTAFKDTDHVIFVPNSQLFGPSGNAKGVSAMLPGNPDVKLLAALEHEALRPFDIFIRVEFDVTVSHDIEKQYRELIDIAKKNDFCCVSFFNQSDVKNIADWPWLKTFTNRLDSEKSFDGGLCGGMLQICTFNRRFEQIYREFLAAGWTGHYEVLMPTAAAQAGLSIQNLRSSKILDYAVFGVRAPAVFPTNKRSFFHPVKTLDDFVRLPIRTIRGYTFQDIELPPAIRCFSSIRMTAEEISALREALLSSDRYLEFGSGGSTVIACHLGVQTIHSIESDFQFLSKLVQDFDLQDFIRFGRLHLHHVDIGKTGAWGTPVGTQHKHRWHRYLDVAWRDIMPDTIMIDGRFRVATAARAYLELHRSKAPSILIHDFFGRGYYDDVLKFLELEKKTASLGRFSFIPDREEAAREVFESFRHDSR